MLDLLDYRRQTFELYRTIREQGTDNPASFSYFKSVRDNLFAHHSQSPLDAARKARFTGLVYEDYNPAYRLTVPLKLFEQPVDYDVSAGDDGMFTMRQIGEVQINLPEGQGTFGVFWLAIYGGGIFIPFRDATNGEQTYGGGRYLLDTIKGADMGMIADEMVLDFNYAYHPSCHYNFQWVCPLAPPQNRLNFPVYAGEQAFADAK
ncbi:MAG: DUF1684 domain-containing protein [Aggregatilineales bacterium]